MKKITYKTAGVDIEKANALIEKIKKQVKTTRVPGSMDTIGGFSAFFDPKKTGIKDPLLVASTDGVGTKLKIAIEAGKNDTVGIDLVAMCVNDCLCSGARPIFFLDYFATGKLDGRVWLDVIRGIIAGCKKAGCALLGGETAEMPGMYKKRDYDIAGFSVGVVDRRNVIDGKKIKKGDVLLGIESSGLHSNGYSLVRKIFTAGELKKKSGMFLRPTHIYVKPVMDVIKKCSVKGAVNITGGGFYDNIPRILPKGCGVTVKRGSWRIPPVFALISKKASIPEKELYRTFNMGIGMILMLRKKESGNAASVLRKHGLRSWVIGEVVTGRREVKII